MSDISQVVKSLCAMIPGARAPDSPVNPSMMQTAFAAILDGGASDLELGALMAVSASLEARGEGELVAEIVLGLSDAIRERLVPLKLDDISGPLVIMPNYGDEGRNAGVPLLALLLQRLGIRVLVHGALETYGGLFNCSVFREFGILPATTKSQAQRQLLETGVALLPTTLFSPGLAAMMSLRNRLGIGTPANILANLLMPVIDPAGKGLHVLQAAQWLKPFIENEGLVLNSPALLFATAHSGSWLSDYRPSITYHDGERATTWQTLFHAEHGVMGHSEDSVEAAHPVGDARSWAAWTKSQLEGKAILPVPTVNQLASCLYGCGYANSFNEAKAIAAVEVGSLAAA